MARKWQVSRLTGDDGKTITFWAKVLNQNLGLIFGLTPWGPLRLHSRYYQGYPTSQQGYIDPADRLRRTLQAVKEKRGLSALPPRLLQVTCNAPPAHTSVSNNVA